MTQTTLDDITLDSFIDAIKCAVDGGHSSVAPLGWSGENIYLHKKESRVQEVSIRLYCGDAELLITDEGKSFLFYGRYDFALGIDFIAREYFRIFTLLKSEIPKVKEKRERLKLAEHYTHTVGFKMLEALA